MKSIKIYLLPLLLISFFSTQGFSQDDFYNNKNEKEKVEQKTFKSDSLLVHGYFTERDYNEIYNVKEQHKNTHSEIYYGDEAYNEEELRRRERDNFFGEVAAEVIVEVVVNTLFILATCWH